VTWAGIEAWLMETLWGTVVRGLVISILAVFVVKAGGALLRPLLRSLLERMASFGLRPVAMSMLLCYRFINDGRPSHLVTWVVSTMIFLAVDVIVFWVFFIAAMIVTVTFGASARGLLLALVGFTGFMLFVVIRDLTAYAGIWSVLFHKDWMEIRDMLKGRGHVFFAIEHLLNLDAKSRSTAPPAPPPPPPTHPENSGACQQE
jgi:hypothetical protein